MASNRKCGLFLLSLVVLFAALVQVKFSLIEGITGDSIEAAGLVDLSVLQSTTTQTTAEPFDEPKPERRNEHFPPEPNPRPPLTSLIRGREVIGDVSWLMNIAGTFCSVFQTDVAHASVHSVPTNTKLLANIYSNIHSDWLSQVRDVHLDAPSCKA